MTGKRHRQQKYTNYRAAVTQVYNTGGRLELTDKRYVVVTQLSSIGATDKS